MTNHSYFNLSGDPSKISTDHIMYVNADYYTPVDSTFMTTGEIAPVKDTPMDFTTPKAVGKEINNYDFVQLKNGNGYDHNWVLNTKGDLSQAAAKLTSPESGITLEVYTNEPGIQVYTGNFLDGTVSGKERHRLQPTCFCLPRNTTLPRQPQQGRLAVCCSGTGTNVQQRMYLSNSRQRNNINL